MTKTVKVSVKIVLLKFLSVFLFTGHVVSSEAAQSVDPYKYMKSEQAVLDELQAKNCKAMFDFATYNRESITDNFKFLICMTESGEVFSFMAILLTAEDYYLQVQHQIQPEGLSKDQSTSFRIALENNAQAVDGRGDAGNLVFRIKVDRGVVESMWKDIYPRVREALIESGKPEEAGLISMEEFSSRIGEAAHDISIEGSISWPLKREGELPGSLEHNGVKINRYPDFTEYEYPDATHNFVSAHLLQVNYLFHRDEQHPEKVTDTVPHELKVQIRTGNIAALSQALGVTFKGALDRVNDNACNQSLSSLTP